MASGAIEIVDLLLKLTQHLKPSFLILRLLEFNLILAHFLYAFCFKYHDTETPCTHQHHVNAILQITCV